MVTGIVNTVKTPQIIKDELIDSTSLETILIIFSVVISFNWFYLKLRILLKMENTIARIDLSLAKLNNEYYLYLVKVTKIKPAESIDPHI
jgi:hypothetical protein